ncbi:hypothetical protein [Cytophaga aurantiaca]|uniref:hypothetical protein n=1 Tax=Cytophaga aurantiaca TaxID=29530 RepID=UPI0003A83587|nr:hypothetical protein [Cytophaga aurantiaca]
MKTFSIVLIFSAFLISCLTSKTSTTSEVLLWGDWYGGPGTKYSVSGNKKEWIQDLPASNTLFVYGQDHIFIHQARGDKSVYKLKGNKIYSDMDKPDKKRYYIIETLSADSLIVVGPYKGNKKLYVPGILYRLSYYRKK